ncbi:uncharacterized protein LOC112569223 isoform X2 [Pomacea canaliculata]|uniref:uncharacterized protein LOC112569223 isoform X2 n=1 Tax=Pomacea canaliculata TaxID=400727 RepID=UPI000D72DA31|nr:uncharacterized protein LOC112569223 isoform X2 [Pomacea canaliculata]
MSCTTEVEEKSQLFCTFPQSVDRIEDIVVYFNPSSGNERMVVRCMMLEELECNNERGFSCRVPDPHLAEITLPDSFKTESGSFRCQTSGLAKSEIKRCMWLSEEKDSAGGAIEANTTLTHERLHGMSTAAVAVPVAIIAALVILAVIGIVLYKRVYKKGPSLSKNPKLNTKVPSTPSTNERCTQKNVKDENTDSLLQNDSPSEEGRSHSPLLLNSTENDRSSTGHHPV